EKSRFSPFPLLSSPFPNNPLSVFRIGSSILGDLSFMFITHRQQQHGGEHVEERGVGVHGSAAVALRRAPLVSSGASARQRYFASASFAAAISFS
ncbi:MAG TPA: hypothetical protein VF348_12900, partial [Usitatibacter sp.]